MNTEKLNRWLTLGANIGVLFGIVFLGVELRQNNDALQAQTREESYDQIMEFAEQIMGNPALASAISKVEKNEQLDGTEELLLRAMALRTFRQLEWQFLEDQAGRLESPLPLKIYRKGFRSRGIFRCPLGKYWVEMKEFCAPDFVKFVEENIVATETG